MAMVDKALGAQKPNRKVLGKPNSLGKGKRYLRELKVTMKKRIGARSLTRNGAGISKVRRKSTSSKGKGGGRTDG